MSYAMNHDDMLCAAAGSPEATPLDRLRAVARGYVGYRRAADLEWLVARCDEMYAVLTDIADDNHPIIERDHQPDGTIHVRCRYNCGLSQRTSERWGHEPEHHQISCTWRRAHAVTAEL